MTTSLFEEKRPLYQQVAEQLTNAIEQGHHPIGSMLPTEAELCARFDVRGRHRRCGERRRRERMRSLAARAPYPAA